MIRREKLRDASLSLAHMHGHHVSRSARLQAPVIDSNAPMQPASHARSRPGNRGGGAATSNTNRPHRFAKTAGVDDRVPEEPQRERLQCNQLIDARLRRQAHGQWWGCCSSHGDHAGVTGRNECCRSRRATPARASIEASGAQHLQQAAPDGAPRTSGGRCLADTCA